MKLKARDILRAWLLSLAARVAGTPGQSTLVGEDGWCRYSAPPDARSVLKELLELYWQGLRAPLKFFPESALAFAEAELKQLTSTKPRKGAASPLDVARKKWDGPDFPPGIGERENAYFDLCFRSRDPLGEEFAAL